MGEINDVLGAHGAGRVGPDDRTYFRPTFKEKAKYERWLEDSARNEIRQWKETLDADDFQKQVAARAAMISAFSYSWGSDLCEGSLESHPGRIRILYIVAQRSEPAVKIETVAEAYYENIEEFVELLEWMKIARPNSKPVAQAPAKE